MLKKPEMKEKEYVWHENSVAAITVCNANAEIIYMNRKARLTFEKYGQDLTGRSLYECHGERSAGIIRQLLAEGGTNVYTIEKNGVKKLIHQSAWLNEEGRVGGLTEISVELPSEMPHFIR